MSVWGGSTPRCPGEIDFGKWDGSLKRGYRAIDASRKSVSQSETFGCGQSVRVDRAKLIPKAKSGPRCRPTHSALDHRHVSFDVWDATFDRRPPVLPADAIDREGPPRGVVDPNIVGVVRVVDNSAVPRVVLDDRFVSEGASNPNDSKSNNQQPRYEKNDETTRFG